MSKNKKHLFTCCTLILLTGCASYNASTLSLLSTETAIHSNENPNVLVSWRAFDQNDCATYLDRNVLAEGYVPLQLTIRNNSNDPMFLSPDNFSTPISSPNEVANKVHTSTGGRIAAWGVGGLIFFPLLVPAVVDGFKSANANDALDADYREKTLKEHTIQPHSSFNGVVFIPSQYADQKIQLFLVNQRTHQKVAFSEIPLLSRDSGNSWNSMDQQ
jgi:hypothetical protein